MVAVGNPDHPCIKLFEIIKLAAGIEKQLSLQGQTTAFDRLTDCRKGFFAYFFLVMEQTQNVVQISSVDRL